MSREIKEIAVGTYSHLDVDANLTLSKTCLFALCVDGTLWLMRDPSGDETSEYWTQLPNPPAADA